MVTKKNTLIISSLGVVPLLFLIVFQQTCDYDAHGLCWRYWSEIGMLGEYFVIFIPLFLFSLATYFMRDEIFRVWVKFAIPWTALSMFLIFLAPEYGQGGFAPAISLDKSFVALIMSALSVLVSILIIAWKHFTTRSR